MSYYTEKCKMENYSRNVSGPSKRCLQKKFSTNFIRYNTKLHNNVVQKIIIIQTYF